MYVYLVLLGILFRWVEDYLIVIHFQNLLFKIPTLRANAMIQVMNFLLMVTMGT